MTIKDRQVLDNRLRMVSRAAKFIRKHINKTVGEWLQDRIYDFWDSTY